MKTAKFAYMCKVRGVDLGDSAMIHSKLCYSRQIVVCGRSIRLGRLAGAAHLRSVSLLRRVVKSIAGAITVHGMEHIDANIQKACVDAFVVSVVEVKKAKTPP